MSPAKWMLLALFVVGQGRAEQISLKFESAPVVDVVRVVYSDVAGLPVVISGAALRNSERVTMLLPKISREAAMVQIEAIAAQSGLRIDKSAGVVVVDKREEEAEGKGEVVYRPRYRAVTYLVDLLSPLFSVGAFSYQRGVRPLQDAKPMVDATKTATAQPAVKVDTGGTAYSLIDKAPDVLLFKGTALEVSRLEKLLRQLDTPTPELLVKAMVYEVSTVNTERSAIAIAASLLRGKLSIAAGSAAAGDYSAVFKNATLTAIYDALSQDSRFKVVSQPQVRLGSGSSGRLMVGTKTPVVNGSQLDRNGNTITTVDYKPSGVILDLKADVRGDVSQLTIDQEISQFSATTNGVNNTPTLITRQLQTSVSMADGEVLVIGGLDEEKSEVGSAGLSWLPAFLRSSNEQRSKTEILLFLQAQRI